MARDMTLFVDDDGTAYHLYASEVSVKTPRLRYPVGKGVTLSRLRRFVPAGMFDRSLRKQFQLD